MKLKRNNQALNDDLTHLTRKNQLHTDELTSRISTLESDLRLAKLQNARKEEKIKKLSDENEKLKTKLQEKSEEQKKMESSFREELSRRNSKLQCAEDLVSQERKKNLELLETIIETEEKNKQCTIDQESFLLLEGNVLTLKKSFSSVRQKMRELPSAMDNLFQATILKVQAAVQEMNQTNEDLVKRYAREIQLRKRYHNQLVELRGNIRVFCRVRPGNNGEQNLSFDSLDDGIVRVNHKGRNQVFELDKAFDTTITQTQIFEEVSDLVRSVLDGFNVCIFAYGQTGSGKTYTMEGPSHDPGINQRALQFLYQEMEGTQSSWQYSLETSVLEVYNETIRDLLRPDANAKLEIKLKADGGLNVPGLTKVPISSLKEANQVFQMGCDNRAVEATNMNDHSSRSHCLVCVSVKGVNLLTGNRCFGQLNLVDLAGSERVGRSLAEGPRLKEAQNINKSLATLGDVISAVKNKHQHIPYRNSKLTYLLRESLGGDSKTLMLLQVSPEEANIAETICTLSFGQRVRSAELGPATRRCAEGHKGTPSSMRRADTLQASPSLKY